MLNILSLLLEFLLYFLKNLRFWESQNSHLDQNVYVHRLTTIAVIDAHIAVNLSSHHSVVKVFCCNGNVLQHTNLKKCNRLNHVSRFPVHPSNAAPHDNKFSKAYLTKEQKVSGRIFISSLVYLRNFYRKYMYFVRIWRDRFDYPARRYPAQWNLSDFCRLSL